MQKLKWFVFFWLMFQNALCQGVSKPDELEIPLAFDSDKLFIPVVAIETWAIQSFNKGTEDNDIAGRLDVMMRRFRFGGKGMPVKWLGYNFELCLDWLGKTIYSPVRGSYSGVDVWKAFVSLNPLKTGDWLHLHVGYIQAVVSREYNTSSWTVGSFDKTQSSWHLRYFNTGKGNGIESGLLLGGLKNFEKMGFSYRVGLFSPQKYQSAGYVSPLVTGRAMLTIGEPEQTNYSFMLSGNHWGHRTGVSVGVGASYTGKTEAADLVWQSSVSYGGDLLINCRSWQLDAQYYRMTREYLASEYAGSGLIVRLSYCLKVANTILEPCLCYDKYVGEGEASLYQYIGDNITRDVGVNWYLKNDKLKVSLHYLEQSGNLSVDRGNYLGTALQFRL
ncbi:hypothetical protein ACT3CD_07020 [Geofilum sp. OHC36d9]|uniref:hypothetical protein n=1 Tax=Geofilum sp. OHC36d9 TaxID=3458413 RepID=UPI004033CBE0